MKRIIIVIMTLVFLTGCNKIYSGSVKKQSEQKEKIQVDFGKVIEKLTDDVVHKMIIEDFDDDGEKEAFVLTGKSSDIDEGEDEFELWFLSSNKSQKIIEAFVGENSTSIELFKADKKYIILNVAQIRQNDDMKCFIYGVENDNAIELFAKERMNLLEEDNELYAYNYSYCVLEPEFKEWMSLSEQKYHFKWDNKKQMCIEYCASEISREDFMNMDNSDELRDIIRNRIEAIYSNNVKDVEYEYLLREDDYLDVNMILTMKNGIKYKYYITTKCNKNILKTTNIELLEGNKEKSLIDYLSTICGE